MTQLFNLKSKFWYNMNLYFRAAMVAAAVIAFVCVSYMDLTRTENPPKKEIENAKEINDISKGDVKSVILDVKG